MIFVYPLIFVALHEPGIGKTRLALIRPKRIEEEAASKLDRDNEENVVAIATGIA